MDANMFLYYRRAGHYNKDSSPNLEMVHDQLLSLLKNSMPTTDPAFEPELNIKHIYKKTCTELPNISTLAGGI